MYNLSNGASNITPVNGLNWFTKRRCLRLQLIELAITCYFTSRQNNAGLSNVQHQTDPTNTNQKPVSQESGLTAKYTTMNDN